MQIGRNGGEEGVILVSKLKNCQNKRSLQKGTKNIGLKKTCQEDFKHQEIQNKSEKTIGGQYIFL